MFTTGRLLREPSSRPRGTHPSPQRISLEKYYCCEAALSPREFWTCNPARPDSCAPQGHGLPYLDLLLTLQVVPRTQQTLTTYGLNDKTTVHTGPTPDAILLCPLYSHPLADTSDQLIFYLVQCLMYCWHSINNDQQFGISV